MITTLIFDLDGVIADTAKYHFFAWQEIATELGIHFTKEDNEKLKGISRMKSLNFLLDLAKKEISQTKKEEFAEKKNKRYIEYISKMTPEEILPGVENFLKDAKSKGVKIALGSASQNAMIVLNKTNLTHYFDVIIDGNSVTKPKPDPDVFLKGAEALHSKPEECIVFEDAAAGTEAAAAAGMYCIGIGFSENLPAAQYTFNGFKNLTFDKVIETITELDWVNKLMVE